MATIIGLKRVESKLNSIANIKPEEAVNKVTTFIHAQAKMLAPYSSVRESIHMKVDKKAEEVIGKVYTNLKYAPYVEFGTGIRGNGTYKHRVKGLSLQYKNKGWIYTPDDGETFFYTEGQPAKPYMYPAFNKGKNFAKKTVSDDIKMQIKTICKGA